MTDVRTLGTTIKTQPVYGLPSPGFRNRYSRLILSKPSLRSYWRLNDLGTSAADSRGGVTGAIGSGVTVGQMSLLADRTGGSFLFDGSLEAKVMLGRPTMPTDIMTLMMMVHIDGYPSSGLSYGLLSDGSGGFYIRISDTGSIAILRSQLAVIGSSNVILAPGYPHHIAWTKDGSANHIYIDGVDVTGSISDATLTAPTEDASIGADHGGTSEYYAGYLSEVAVFTAALDSDEIAALYRLSAGI